ncbi:MAG: VOC family protein [Sandaracinaceae bacterium]|nr:VOC family protein [Sandaracinaceae bacterium]
MTEPTYTPGMFVWRELNVPDLDKAKGFYGELFNWAFEDVPMGDFDYPMIKAGDQAIGGMMKMEGAEHPPHWMSYVSVEDVDASAKAAAARGGKVAVGPMDIPNVGRFAVVGDPDGAWVTVFRAAQGDPAPGQMPGLGTFCWETLSANDLARAEAFYAEVVGWSVGPGPGGPDNHVFKVGEVAVADVQKAQNMPPSWATYVVVANLADAHAKLTKLGGKTFLERYDVPGVGGIGFFADPQGAMLGLFEPSAG